jgi:tetratricopeptide (TPR) repeat protein
MLLALQAGAQAQFSFPGQASSPEEFDSYLLVLEKTSPKDIISATADFEQRWPHSGLIAHVFELEAEAYASLGDAAKAIRSNERALDAAPDNLVVLANLAYVIANSASNSQQLARAEECARRELKLSQTIVIPKKISPQEWEEIRNRIGSTAHASLGLVAYKRGDLTEAIREFEAAVRLEQIPDPAQYYRLGMLYRASGNQSKALEMLRRAAGSNDPTIRQLAEAELSRITSR